MLKCVIVLSFHGPRALLLDSWLIHCIRVLGFCLVLSCGFSVSNSFRILILALVCHSNDDFSDSES